MAQARDPSMLPVIDEKKKKEEEEERKRLVQQNIGQNMVSRVLGFRT